MLNITGYDNEIHFSENDDDVVLDSQGGVRSAETPILNPSKYEKIFVPWMIIITYNHVLKFCILKITSTGLSCTFGNLKLNIGEQLNQATDYSSVCLKCICEVPPMLTCKRLPDNECDVTVHAPFNN